MNSRGKNMKRSLCRAYCSCCRNFKMTSNNNVSSIGNAAFDEWRRSEMDKIDAERRKLDDAHAEFDRYTNELRKARDSEEFDRFMNERGGNRKD